MSHSLMQLARVIRSKNAGPFELTLDVIFDDPATYRRVKAQDILNSRCIASLYQVPPEDVLVCMYFDQALAFKATLRRRWPQGSVGERDTFGAQQHAPLLSLQVG